MGPVEVVHRAKVDVEDAVSVTTVGIGADSAVTLAWREQLSTGGDLFNHPLRAATRASTGAWSPPQTLTSRCDAYGVQVSVNARGDTLVVCAWSTLYRGRIVGIQRPLGEAWGDSTPITRSLGGFEGDWLSHSSVLSDSGEALVTYQSTRSRAIWSKSATVR